MLRDGAESGGGPGFSAVGAACQVVGVLAHDPGMAEIIVAAGASEPLVALLSTEAAAAAWVDPEWRSRQREKAPQRQVWDGGF